MGTDGQFDISSSLSEILQAKLNFHLAEADKNIKEANKIRKAMAQLEDSQYIELEPNEDVTTSSDPEKISQRTVRPIVESFLKNNPGRYTTVEIFERLAAEDRSIERRRQDWIAAISSTMHTLTANGNVIAYPTDKGRIKTFEYKNKESKASNFFIDAIAAM